MNPSSKDHTVEYSFIPFFFGLQTVHIFFLFTSRLAWFLQCFHPLSVNCHGLSNLLGLLAVCLSELKPSFIYNSIYIFGFSSCSDINK